MTSASGHGQEPVDRWLASRHHRIHNGLRPFLNLSAGLRDAMLHAGHADLLGSLDSGLDTEAGLADILTPPAPAAPRPTPGTPQRGSSLPDMTAAITAADPAVRMALRRSPVILAVLMASAMITYSRVRFSSDGQMTFPPACTRDDQLPVNDGADLARATPDSGYARLLADPPVDRYGCTRSISGTRLRASTSDLPRPISRDQKASQCSIEDP